MYQIRKNKNLPLVFLFFIKFISDSDLTMPHLPVLYFIYKKEKLQVKGDFSWKI